MAATANSQQGLYLVVDNTGKHQMGDRIARIDEVCELTGLSRTTIWRRMRKDSFPQSVRLGPEGTRARGWRLSEIQAWIDELATAA